MDQFEYKRLFYRAGFSKYGWHSTEGVVGNPKNNDIWADLEQILQDHGQQGWELAGVVSQEQVFLKRRMS